MYIVSKCTSKTTGSNHFARKKLVKKFEWDTHFHMEVESYLRHLFPSEIFHYCWTTCQGMWKLCDKCFTMIRGQKMFNIFLSKSMWRGSLVLQQQLSMLNLVYIYKLCWHDKCLKSVFTCGYEPGWAPISQHPSKKLANCSLLPTFIQLALSLVFLPYGWMAW